MVEINKYNLKMIMKSRKLLIILNTPSNVDFKIHEDNQNQGAWGPEERIHFYSEEGVPECLKRQMTDRWTLNGTWD